MKNVNGRCYEIFREFNKIGVMNSFFDCKTNVLYSNFTITMNKMEADNTCCECQVRHSKRAS